jgi:predicted amidohydrolase YtcJ
MKYFSVLIVFVFAVSAAAMRTAELVITNAVVRTMDRAGTRAEGVAVIDGRITAVGTNKAIKAFIGPDTVTIDANGQLLLPGFNDAHVHFMAIGNTFSSLDLRSTASVDELAKRIAYNARFLPKGRWIIGSQLAIEGELGKLRSAIDLVSPDHPVLIYFQDPNVALVNGRALSLAGIVKGRRAPASGAIETAADGEPTGIIRGKAIDLVRRVVPQDHTRRWSEIAETASNYAASLGITSVQDVHSDDMVAIYRDLERQGKLKTRVYDCASLTDAAKRAARPVADPDGGFARNGCLKSFADSDEEWAAKLREMIFSADSAGHQVAIHAIGSSSNEVLIDILAALRSKNGIRDRRFRIEHAEGIRTEDVARLEGLSVIASVQPHLFGGGFAGNGAYYTSLSRAGAVLAMGSDAPMTDLDPLLGLRAAVNGGEMSIGEAIRAYTYGSAFAEFQEKEKGTIEVGKLADLVILSEDVVADHSLLNKARVMTTIVNGKVVYTFREN